MSDEDLGELAVKNNFISGEELQACREAQRISDPPRPLGEILLEMQLITRTQLDRLTQMQQPQLPDTGRDQVTAIADLFGRLAVELGFCSQAQVEECLAEQRLLDSQGQRMRLGQIMLKRRSLTTDQFLEILKLQEKTVLTCPSCNAKYLVGDLGEPQPGGVFRCLACQTLLNLPAGMSDVLDTSAATRTETPAVLRAAEESPEVTRSTPVPMEAPTVADKPLGPESAVETIRLGSRPPSSHVPDSPSTAATMKVPPSKPPSTHHGEGRPFGRYLIFEAVGKGPIGIVYRARDTQRQRKVALKMLKDPEIDPQIAQRFLREARVAAQLDHPGIVEIYEVGSNEETPYFSMEFIEGAPLDQAVRERKFSRDDIVSILEKVARALDYAHSQGVAHRNLKPSNLLIDAMKSPHLCDFGAREGVNAYLSPEQVRGDEETVDAVSDVYSLGVILYEALTGKTPHEGIDPDEMSKRILSGTSERPSAVLPDVPRELEIICLKAMDRDRTLRYGTAGEMADDLRRYLEGEPITARPISVVTRVGSRMRRHKLAAALVVLFVCLGVGGSVFGLRWWRDYRQEKARREAEERRARAKPPYEAALKIHDDQTKMLLQDRESLRDLRRNVDEIVQRLDQAHRLAAKSSIDGTTRLSEAREKFVQASKALASASAVQADVRRLIEEGNAAYAGVLSAPKKPPEEIEKLLKECNPRYDDAVRFSGRIRGWPGEVRRALEDSAAKLGESLREDADSPEATHLRAKVLQLLGRLAEAGEDFRKAAGLYAKRIEEFERDATIPRETIDDLRKKSIEHRYDRGKHLYAVYELWRGRPLLLFGAGAETLSFAAQETPPAEAVRREMVEEFKAFLAAGKGGRVETTLANTAVLLFGDGGGSGPKLAEVEPFLRDDRTDGVALRVLAAAYLREKLLKKAFEHLHTSIQLSPPLLEGGELFGLSLHPRVSLEWALAAHSVEIARAPSPELFVNRGVLRMALRQFSEARQDFDEALKLRSEDPEAALRKIDLAAFLGDKLDAHLPTLNKLAASGGATAAEALRLKAAALLSQGDAEEAFKEIDKAVKLSSDDPTLIYLRGRIQLARGESSQAMIDATKATDTIKTFYQAYELRGASKVEVRDFLGALDDVNRAIELRPDYAPAYVTRARARFFRSDPTGAEQDLDRALQLDPRHFRVWVVRGDMKRTALRQGIAREQYRQIATQAAEMYEKAIALNATCTDALVMRALCRLENGESTTLDEFDAIIEKHPKCAQAYEIRGRIFYDIGQRTQSVPNFESAIENWTKARDLQPARRLQFSDQIAEAQRQIDAIKSLPAWLKAFKHAQEFVQANNYPEARRVYEEGVKALPADLPSKPDELYWLTLGGYNFACVLAVEAKTAKDGLKQELYEKAFKWLKLACELGYRNWQDNGRCHPTAAEHMRKDEDLELLRKDPRFKKLVGYTEE